MKRLPSLFRLVVLILLVVLAGASSPAGPARSPAETASLALSPFSVIHSANVSDYGTYQFKITYLGPQIKATPSLFGVGTGRAFSLPAFVPYKRNFSYANDAIGHRTLTLSSVEFKAFVDAIGLHPTLTDTTLRSHPNASVMILRDSGPSTRCWEHLCPTEAQTDTLFQALHDALPDSTRQAIVDHYRHMMAGVRR